jgi:hypothetical protein
LPHRWGTTAKKSFADLTGRGDKHVLLVHGNNGKWFSKISAQAKRGTTLKFSADELIARKWRRS